MKRRHASVRSIHSAGAPSSSPFNMQAHALSSGSLEKWHWHRHENGLKSPVAYYAGEEHSNEVLGAM
eukprot:scaffold301626_cov20-Prasinocladus_malaysianus.AAC.4